MKNVIFFFLTLLAFSSFFACRQTPQPEQTQEKLDFRKTFPIGAVLERDDFAIEVGVDEKGSYITNTRLRTVSFNELEVSHSTADYGDTGVDPLYVGFVFFDSARYDHEYSDHSMGRWLVFDKKLTACDTLDFSHTEGRNGYVFSETGIYDGKTGKLRFRSYVEICSGAPPAESYALIVEKKNGGYYLTVDPELSSGPQKSFFLDPK